MQLNEIINNFNFEKVILFDKDAIVVHKKGEIDDMLIVELTDYFKQISKFEIVDSEELSIKLEKNSIMIKKIDDYFLAVIVENDSENEKLFFNFFLLINRLKRELI